MPALGVLLALRDLQTHRTIKAIMNLPENQLEIITTLSDSYAPDLASNLTTQSSSSDVPLGSSKLWAEKRADSYNGKYKEDSLGFNSSQSALQNSIKNGLKSQNSLDPTKPVISSVKEVVTLGFPDSKTIYTNSDLETLIDNIKNNIDSRIE